MYQLGLPRFIGAGVLAEGAKTTAYTYIGEKITWDIYWHGTIGAAKQDLDKRVVDIRTLLAGHIVSEARNGPRGWQVVFKHVN